MNRCYVIAEAGVNHNGSLDMALELVEVAAASGADAIKFQTFRADKLVAKGTKTAEYQQRQTGDLDQYAMLKRLELSEEAHRVLFERCKALDIEFMSTPFDEAAAAFLVELGMEIIKVPSGELTNLPFIRYLAAFDKQLIVSTGMASLEEVRDAVDAIVSVRQELGLSADLQDKLVILHCTSNYPALDQDVNLSAMQTIEKATGLPVGYSDHTEGALIAVAAVACGARVIEKHFTLDRSLPGPDHQASLEPKELTALLTDIRRIEDSMGNGLKEPRDSELPVRDLVRRSVTLVSDVTAGQIISNEDICLKRPGTGIAPKYIQDVVGKRACRDLQAGSQPAGKDLADA
ncbi:N-acetylneuraminate synthase [Marinobacterium jannaschii]|uniref:N-acetylneuraminate synthase n=1 Tax=Marinobacterium jannaschii TaxID=64970 RepID=UPI00047F2C44|nr:N-acetylneuraminate synthase [Marinobacterium jannaschii]